METRTETPDETWTGTPEETEKGINWLEKVVKSVPPDDPNRGVYLCNLGVLLVSRYGRTGAPEDMKAAIYNFEEAVKATPPDHPVRPRILYNLGIELRQRYDRTRVPEDLEEAIRTYQEAIKIAPSDHPDRAIFLHALGVLLVYRYGRTGAPEDIKAAIYNFEEAVKATPPDHPVRPMILHSLGIELRKRYDRTRVPEDLEEAIRTYQEAIKIAPSDHPDRAIFLHALGDMLGIRYERTSELGNLDEAIWYVQEAVKVTPERGYLTNLGVWLGMRYGSSGAREDLEGAISNTEEALKATPLNDPDLAILHSHLGDWFGYRYTRTGALKDLNKAIYHSEEAVKGTPLDHPDRSICLNNMGNRLWERYESTGALEDLEETMKYREKALEATPPDLITRAGCLSNLGGALVKMYERTRALDDLEEGIRVLREAIKIMPTDHFSRIAVLCNLGTLLGQTHERREAFKDLEEGIGYLQEVIKLTPIGHHDRARSFHNLGVLLSEKYRSTRVFEDLVEAIRSFQEALDTLPPDHPKRATGYYHLADQISYRYKVTEKLEDLEEAIRYSREAVKATPDDHPDQALHSYSLGILLESKSKLTKLPEDFESVVASLSVAVSMENALPMPRIWAGRLLGNLLARNGRLFEASKALESAVNLLPTVSPSSLSRDDQQYVLGQFSGISSLAASVTLEANRPASDALIILEAGRCVIAGFAINSRSDISDLRASHTTICKEYEKCREAINYYRTGMKFNTNDKYRWRAASLKKLLRDLTAIETQIRQIPGFKQFQLPPQPTDLMRLANSGPIVAFNVSTIRSDAIIVTSTRIWAIKLPRLSYDKLVAKAKSIATAGVSSRRNVKVRVSNNRKHYPKEQVHKDLLWLWKKAVRPVLDELGLLQLQQELGLQQLQRVWWVNGGVMGLVPIHAAGDHSKGSLDNTFSCVVSSYTSTFRSLRYAREKVKDETPDYRMLLVDMPETPDHEVLNTEHEVKVIKNEFGEFVTLLKHPTKAEVMAKLGGCSFAHFACHGTSNPEDPAEGGLLLSEEGKPTLLSVRELDTVNLQHAELAYLSACSTAELPTGTLVDEAIHLSNSFQMIGFRHVIGTMWGADDHAAGEVAGLFYKALLSKSKGDSGGELRVAQALHDAVVKFRSRPNIREDVLMWGPFIHVGV